MYYWHDPEEWSDINRFVADLQQAIRFYLNGSGPQGDVNKKSKQWDEGARILKGVAAAILEGDKGRTDLMYSPSKLPVPDSVIQRVLTRALKPDGNRLKILWLEFFVHPPAAGGKLAEPLVLRFQEVIDAAREVADEHGKSEPRGEG